ncbi:uncharacterized protein PG998_003867 [Apiospora kogelbergensis]|uniref:Uncharacterized protein n=1 Tax=Apiospora kogelbergensis TaxID=1337665 RepID=A0AAW0QQ02_9PEZI
MKFVALVEFEPQTTIWYILSRSPLILKFLDGWVQGQALAREKIDIGVGLPNTLETRYPSLLTCVHSLGSYTGWSWQYGENVAVDATFSLMILLII